MRLDGERHPARGPDRAAEEYVIREDDVGGQQAANGTGICLHPRFELGARAVLDASHVVAVVAVEDEDGEQSSDVRSHRLRGAEVVLARIRLL